MLPFIVVLLGLLGVAGCGRKVAKPINVGATTSVEHALLAEIAAQIIERRGDAEVVRSFEFGSSTMAYQAMMMTHVDILPEDVNAIVSVALKDTLDSDPLIVFQRARSELARTARVRVMEPLGIQRRFAMITTPEIAAKHKAKTLSDATVTGQRWMMAHTTEFHDRPDGYKALVGAYPLRQEVAPMLLKSEESYQRLADGYVELVAGYDTDGQLEGSQFITLEDDQKAFREGRTCLLVRQDVMDRHEGLRAALEQLTGRFDNARIRKLNHEVVVKKRTVADVARQFLAETKL